MRVWKYHLASLTQQTLMLPCGAKVLDVQVQDNEYCLWALCDETAEETPRQFAIYGTGYQLPNEPGEYIATSQVHDGALVFHVFELSVEK